MEISNRMNPQLTNLSDDLRSVGLFALALPFVALWPFLSLAPMVSLIGGSASVPWLLGNAALLATGFWGVAGLLVVLRLLQTRGAPMLPAAVTRFRAGAYAIVWTLLYVAFWSYGPR